MSSLIRPSPRVGALDSKDGLLSVESGPLSAVLGRGRGAERTNQACNQIHICARETEAGDRLPAGNRVPEPGQDFVLTTMMT